MKVSRVVDAVGCHVADLDHLLSLSLLFYFLKGNSISRYRRCCKCEQKVKCWLIIR